MKVREIKEMKEKFRKQFGHDCNNTFAVSIIPEKETIRVATIDSFNTVRELYIPVELTPYEDLNKRKINLGSVDRKDVVWDFIWNKDGFYLETYKNAYRDLETRSKEHGTIFTTAEVVFNTKSKRYIYHSFETDLVPTIE